MSKLWGGDPPDRERPADPTEAVDELDRRLDEAAAHPGQGRTWDEVRDRLLGRR